MSSINLATRELAIKIVYYGPGLGGKTTSLRYVHQALKPDQRGQMISLATGSDRTLYFDFLPIRLPKLGGFRVRAQLYTVPGQVHYNATRKLVLTRADGVVFVADSQQGRAIANFESMQNLIENLHEQDRELENVPLVLQYNKRDVPDPIDLADLEAQLNALKAPAFETVATSGKGIFKSLKTITALVINDVRRSSTLQKAKARAKESGESSEALSAKSLGALGEAVAQLEPRRRSSQSGAHDIPVAADQINSITSLVSQDRAASALTLAEQAIARGDWAGAIGRIDTTYRQMAAELCGTEGQYDSFVMASLTCGVPAPRFLRFSELCNRVAAHGAVASADALFALFFLIDFALRLEEQA